MHIAYMRLHARHIAYMRGMHACMRLHARHACMHASISPLPRSPPTLEITRARVQARTFVPVRVRLCLRVEAVVGRRQRWQQPLPDGWAAIETARGVHRGGVAEPQQPRLYLRLGIRALLAQSACM